METTTRYQLKEIQWPERTFITKRATVAFDQLSYFFAEQYRALYKALQRQNIAATGAPFAIYYSIDEARRVTDLAAAVPVPGKLADVNGFDKIVMPPCNALTTTYYGPYENMQPVYAEMEKYLVDHNLQRQLIIEEYFSDPQVVKDPAKWKTNIYFILK
jgi:effector-binding domain-containing protein